MYEASRMKLDIGKAGRADKSAPTVGLVGFATKTIDIIQHKPVHQRKYCMKES